MSNEIEPTVIGDVMFTFCGVVIVPLNVPKLAYCSMPLGTLPDQFPDPAQVPPALDFHVEFTNVLEICVMLKSIVP